MHLKVIEHTFEKAEQRFLLQNYRYKNNFDTWHLQKNSKLLPWSSEDEGCGTELDLERTNTHEISNKIFLTFVRIFSLYFNLCIFRLRQKRWSYQLGYLRNKTGIRHELNTRKSNHRSNVLVLTQNVINKNARYVKNYN